MGKKPFSPLWPVLLPAVLAVLLAALCLASKTACPCCGGPAYFGCFRFCRCFCPLAG